MTNRLSHVVLLIACATLVSGRLNIRSGPATILGQSTKCVLNRPTWPIDRTYWRGENLTNLTLAQFGPERRSGTVDARFCAGEAEVYPDLAGKVVEYTVLRTICPKEGFFESIPQLNVRVRRIALGARFAAVIDVIPGVPGDVCEQCVEPGRFADLWQVDVDDGGAPVDLKCAILEGSPQGLETESLAASTPITVDITIDRNLWLTTIYPSTIWIVLFSVLSPAMSLTTCVVALRIIRVERRTVKVKPKQSHTIKDELHNLSTLILWTEVGSQFLLVVYFLCNGGFQRGSLLQLTAFYTGLGGTGMATTVLTAVYWFKLKDKLRNPLKKGAGKQKQRMRNAVLYALIVAVFVSLDIAMFLGTFFVGPNFSRAVSALALAGQAVASVVFVYSVSMAVHSTMKIIGNAQKVSIAVAAETTGTDRANNSYDATTTRLIRTGYWLLASAACMALYIVVAYIWVAKDKVWDGPTNFGFTFFAVYVTRIGTSFTQVKAVGVRTMMSRKRLKGRPSSSQTSVATRDNSTAAHSSTVQSSTLSSDSGLTSDSGLSDSTSMAREGSLSMTGSDQGC